MPVKVSVITINYNNKEGLCKTIESVISQTYKHFEYIIVDGDSTDGSKEVLLQYADQLSYWVSEPDKGIYNAMNKGIRQAKGEYVQFLNSGDWFYDESVLSRVFKKDYPEDILYGHLRKVFSNTKAEVDKGPQRSELTLADMFSSTINHASSFIKRSLFLKHGLYDEHYKIVSDWAFFLKTIGFGEATVRYIAEDIVNFDMSGISNQLIKLRNQERRQELQRVVPSYLFSDYEELMKLRKRTLVLDQIEKSAVSRFAFKVFKKVFL